MKQLIFGVLCLFAVGTSLAQNLVPNGDFEDKRGRRYTHRPWRFLNTVDRFDMTMRQKLPPTFRKWDLPVPQSGEVYVGIRVYPDYREFLQIRLPKELEEGKRYYFEMYVKPSPDFNCYVRELGASFYGRRPSYTSNYYIFKFPPQISYYEHKGIRAEADSLQGWVKIAGSFRARGNEEYLSIGNFSKKKRSDRLKKKRWYQPHLRMIGYYFVDNIQLYELIDATERNDEPLTMLQRIDSTVVIPDSLPYSLEDENYIYRIEKEKQLVLENIRFEFGSDQLIYSSYSDLELVLEYLNSNPTSRLQIIGHTDNVGSSTANLKLSEKRARAVAEYFIRNQIDKTRLEPVGKGENEPVATNETPQGRSKNRRVEILLVP